MKVRVTLRDYLKELRNHEKEKPVHLRRAVPTAQELIEAADTSESNFYKFLRNEHKDINRRLAPFPICSIKNKCAFLIKRKQLKDKGGYSTQIKREVAEKSAYPTIG